VSTADPTAVARPVLALGFARMADAVANSFLVVVLPLFIADLGPAGRLFGLSEAAATGVILATFGVANAFLQPLAGSLSDRLGRRKVFVLGGLLAISALNLLYLAADGTVDLLLIRAGQGLSVAFTVTASVALVNELSGRGNRGGNMGSYNALRLTGFGAGPLVAGFVVEGGPYTLAGLELRGFDAAFLIAAAAALLSSLLVVLLVRDPEVIRERDRSLEVPLRAPPGSGRRIHPILALGIATFVMATCIALLAPIEPQVNRHLQQDARWFGIQFGVFIFSVAGAQPVVGKLSDRWGRKGFVLWGMLLLVPTTLAQGLAATPWQMLFARVAQGLSGAMVFAPALALAGDHARRGQSGFQLAVLTMAFGLGLSGGQLTAGFLIGFGYLVPFVFGAVLAGLAAWMVRSEVVEAPTPSEAAEQPA
jgi:MFS family permease